MTVRQLIAALLAHADGDVDREVYLCPNVQAVDAVELCPGDEHLAPYVVLHSACKYPKDHRER